MSRQREDIEFTFDTYASLLRKAASRYKFVSLEAPGDGEGRALWRHDIDFSPHRALAMARLEAKMGLKANYFVQLSSPFYNPFEAQISDCLKQIADLGHSIGVHFEPSSTSPGDRLSFEARILGSLLGIRINTFSLHNPTTYSNQQLDSAEVCGLINASAPSWRYDFVYCSDSNGLWRHRSLLDVIEDPHTLNLYTLTHSEWWQNEQMTPRERVIRCINGRAEHCLRFYDQLLMENSRPNEGARHYSTHQR